MEQGDRIFYHLADYAYGESVRNEFESRMEELSDDYEAVGETRAEFGATDFEAYITQIESAADEADAVVIGSTGGDLVAFLSQATDRGLPDEIPIVTTTASFTPVRAGAGDAATGVFSGVRYYPEIEMGDNQEFVEAYDAEYDELPDNFSRVGYDSIRMIIRGVQEAGSNDPTEVADVLGGLEQDTIYGPISIRVAGVYFAMITLAFAELYYNLLYRLEITGGSEGIGLIGHDYYYGIAGFGASLDDVAFFVGPVVLTGHSLFYYVVLGALVASYFITRRMLQSPFGSVLKSIRENEERATFLGYETVVYKRRAFVVSGAFAGLAGGLFALNNAFVSPSVAEWLKSGEVIVMVILGGMGTLYGPLIGAGAFFGLEQLLTHYTGRWRLVLGTIFVLFVIFLPRGLVSVPALLAPYLPGGPGPAADPGQLPEDAGTEGDD